MILNTSYQSKNIFHACIGFARQLSQSPGVYCRLEVKLQDKFFSFQTKSSGNFPGKRKSPSDNRRDQIRRNLPRKLRPTSGNHGVSSVAPGVPTGAQNGIISPAPV